MPSSRPLRADARRNREALLSAARQAFLGGETEAHVEDIARSAGVAVGTLYRHFETREALIEEVYRKEVDDLCAAPGALLDQHTPEEALRRFLLLLVEHAAVGKGMSSVLESIMATDSPVFDDARTRMANALSLLLEAGSAAGTVRDDVTGSTLLRALGGICGLRATEGWLVEARQITALLFDGLRNGAPQSP
ncbi:TetR/AcrR family transcriptional regulator [Streptomyces sp. NE06-03E]|uniref:TetR/AcrR family transcriptional regulator n=2 Tax=Streptomyces TaxID=1883 RepID=A0A652LDF8_9ACTN|nr:MULTISPECIES: TetR/AcrR family transcriptional regulator [unclassified Streptomyces]WSS65255.1 TetR/AcrR family transcriptional regulator [Streptomyces sp. NBC_01177]WSS72235.1 TetR/AcrR family transcriptional regulator [Streptomyces sp. NBC_01175]WSS79271.1 TetR/AcrR family transcriptional regulator [Streptomyces sp. NBC_01174]MDX3053745.1 TetR/AcrR family transcriptional regulator [Streptomyces sp. NE06-03E]MDX3427842.1 TetR/AcrR family transcriptional regulator [Streptomyces sp. ME01-18a